MINDSDGLIFSKRVSEMVYTNKLPRKDGYIAYQSQWQNFVPAKYPRIHHFTEFATCQACENSCLQAILFYHSVFTNHTCCHFDFFCILFCDTWGAIASHQDFGFTGLILYDLMADGLPTTIYFTVRWSLHCIQSGSAYCFSISGSHFWLLSYPSFS